MSEEIILDESQLKETIPASKGKRFLNGLIDLIICYLLIIVVGIFSFLIIGSSTADNSIVLNILGYLLYFVYYFGMEASTGKTVGKMITGTKVVSEDGEEPTTKIILARTLWRLIPFDALSFLGNSSVGWHDSIAKSRVINA